jgi:hypothetical protein
MQKQSCNFFIALKTRHGEYINKMKVNFDFELEAYASFIIF